MDYLTLIPDIIFRLRQAGVNADTVEDAFQNSFTASELLFTVTHHLMAMVRQSAAIDQLIGVDVRTLRTYCRSVGLFVH